MRLFSSHVSAFSEARPWSVVWSGREIGARVRKSRQKEAAGAADAVLMQIEWSEAEVLKLAGVGTEAEVEVFESVGRRIDGGKRWDTGREVGIRSGAGRRGAERGGVNLEGQKEVLGLWVAQTEGAKFWLQVLTELQNRGVQDIFIACVDGLRGFPEAIEAVYPRTEVQLCIVHLVRASLNYVPWKARKPVAADLQLIYRAGTAAEAEQQLAQLEDKWKAYPSVSQVWRRNWARITPFFNYPPDIRKAIYTTNSVESLNRSLRKIIKTRGGFPNEEAALKLLFLALRQAAKKWTMPIHHWREALNHFTILWPERMPALERVSQ